MDFNLEGMNVRAYGRSTFVKLMITHIWSEPWVNYYWPNYDTGRVNHWRHHFFTLFFVASLFILTFSSWSTRPALGQPIDRYFYTCFCPYVCPHFSKSRKTKRSSTENNDRLAEWIIGDTHFFSLLFLSQFPHANQWHPKRTIQRNKNRNKTWAKTAKKIMQVNLP